MGAALTFVAALLSACSPVALLNRTIPSGAYEPLRDIAYGPDPRQHLDVYLPAHAAGPTPIVVFFYGGNWNTGSRADYLFVGEALASRGIATVMADYRLYPQVRFPQFLEDSARAVRWTFDHAGEIHGDPDRVFLMGHSAGAYNAAMLALNADYLTAAGVNARRIRGLIGLAGPYDFLPLQSDVTKGVFGYPDTSPETQPIRFVSKSAPPTLLVTGTSDRVVDPGNSVRLAAQLRTRGVEVREVVYAGRGHRAIVAALAAPLRWLAPVLDDVAEFVRTHERAANLQGEGAGERGDSQRHIRPLNATARGAT
ncbi:MAG: alpha/beta hydrolase [Pseudomonadota bacterium]|nr:alpha/beta hydrolase [Pseudomonadota bacterium]